MPFPGPDTFPGLFTFPSMTATTLTNSVQTSLAPWNDSGGAWQTLNGAYATMGEQVYDLVVDQGSPDQPASYTAGWSTLLDPDACPTAFLPYLATFVGVSVPPGTDDTTARALIKAESGQQRGTAAAVLSAAKRWLTGTQTANLYERTAADGTTKNAYAFVIVVLTSEVADATQLRAAVDAVRPAGLTWTLVQTSSWTITQLEAGYATVSAVESAFSTISHLETDQVG